LNLTGGDNERRYVPAPLMSQLAINPQTNLLFHLQVHKNQRVWIRTTGGSGRIDGYNDNTFSGWLLYSLE
jgi:hypothetical protein